MPPTDSSALTQAVLDDARRQAEAILAHSKQQAAAALAQATAETAQARQERFKIAQAEAARRTDAIQATISVEAGRMRAAHVEALLQSLYDEARKRLVARQGYDYRKTLISLVTEAAWQMGDTGLVVKLSPADRVLLGDQFTLIEDPSITCGVVVLDADGRRLWDNRLTARFDRLWPELQRQIVAHIGGRP